MAEEPKGVTSLVNVWEVEMKKMIVVMMAVFAFAPFAMADHHGGNAGEGEGAIGCGYFSPCRDVYPTNPPAPPKGEEQQQQEQQKLQQQRGGQVVPVQQGQQGQQGVSVPVKNSAPACNGWLSASYNLVNGRWVFAGYVCNPDPGGQGNHDLR